MFHRDRDPIALRPRKRRNFLRSRLWSPPGRQGRADRRPPKRRARAAIATSIRAAGPSAAIGSTRITPATLTAATATETAKVELVAVPRLQRSAAQIPCSIARTSAALRCARDTPISTYGPPGGGSVLHATRYSWLPLAARRRRIRTGCRRSCRPCRRPLPEPAAGAEPGRQPRSRCCCRPHRRNRYHRRHPYCRAW